LLLLASTSDKVQIVTTTTADIDVHASFVDLSGSTVTPGRANTKIATGTTTDVVASPAASTVRNVKTLQIANVHASASNVVTIQHTDGTNVVQIESVTLLAGERIAYREGIGTRLIDAAGMEKTNTPVNIGQYTIGTLVSTYTNATTTASKVTGLDLSMGPGSWLFEYFLRCRAATATNGPAFSVNHTGTVTALVASFISTSTNAADASGTIDQDITAAPGTVAGVAQRAKSTAAALLFSTGFDTAAADNFIYGQGIVVVTVAGNLELYSRSEGATQISVEAGSILRATKAA
jgi:peptidyl-tRNA hydrolase